MFAIIDIETCSGKFELKKGAVFTNRLNNYFYLIESGNRVKHITKRYVSLYT